MIKKPQTPGLADMAHAAITYFEDNQPAGFYDAAASVSSWRDPRYDWTAEAAAQHVRLLKAARGLAIATLAAQNMKPAARDMLNRSVALISRVPVMDPLEHDEYDSLLRGVERTRISEFTTANLALKHATYTMLIDSSQGPEDTIGRPLLTLQADIEEPGLVEFSLDYTQGSYTNNSLRGITIARTRHGRITQNSVDAHRAPADLVNDFNDLLLQANTDLLLRNL